MIYEYGLGDASTQQLITNVGASAASVAAPIGLAIAGATSAIPFVGPAILGVTLLIGLFTKHGAQKEAASKIVDAVEPYMKQNLAAWNESTKTKAEQVQALANFDSLWKTVLSKESDPSLGDAGKRGISDRSPGGKWDWFAYYRNPIANDPNVQADSISSVSNLFSSSGGSTNWVVLIGVGLIAYLMIGGKG